MNEFISVLFWKEIFTELLSWIIKAAPSFLVIVLLIFISIKVLNTTVKRLKIFILNQWNKSTTIENIEIEKRINTLIGIVQRIIQVAIWCIIIMIFLKKIGVEIAPLIAGAGIAGLAIGFGGQELVRDVISGFFMLLENHIRTGDVVMVNGTSGLVESIGLRTMKLRDMSGVVHIIQNGKIQTLSNMTMEWSAMVFDIGISYHSDIDKAVEVMKKVGQDLAADSNFSDKIIEPLEVFGVDAFTESAVIIKSRFKTKPLQQWDVGREFLRRLKYALDSNGIEIPFPHRTVFVKNTSET